MNSHDSENVIDNENQSNYFLFKVIHHSLFGKIVHKNVMKMV